MSDDEYRLKLIGWGAAITLGIFFFFILATVVSTRGETQVSLLASAAVKLETGTGHGSAVHLGKGRFLTAAHVAEGEDKELNILTDKGYSSPATLLWSNKGHDLALLQSDIQGVRTAPLACREARVGEDVHASGNPLTFDFITTHGRVVGKARPVSDWETVVPVDATIGPGMSGGPVFDNAENIIGITVGMPSYGMGSKLIRTLLLMVPSTVACDLLARS